MKNSRSVADIIRDADYINLTKSEKEDAIARAEKAEAVLDFIFFLYNAAKKSVMKVKSVVLSSAHQPGHQA